MLVTQPTRRPETRISGAEGVPDPDDAPLIYVDHRALTRDCIANQLAIQLSEFSVATFSAPNEIESLEGLYRQASCVETYRRLTVSYSA